MSVEEARDVVITRIVEWSECWSECEYDLARGPTREADAAALVLEQAIDRLILEVQAGQPCTRTWEPRHSHGGWNSVAEDRSCLGKPRFCTECGAKIDLCPSCTARMKLKELATA